MSVGMIAQIALGLFKFFVSWSAKKDKREEKLLALVSAIDAEIIDNVKFRQRYRDIVTDQKERLDKMTETEKNR